MARQLLVSSGHLLAASATGLAYSLVKSHVYVLAQGGQLG